MCRESIPRATAVKSLDTSALSLPFQLVIHEYKKKAKKKAKKKK